MPGGAATGTGTKLGKMLTARKAKNAPLGPKGGRAARAAQGRREMAALKKRAAKRKAAKKK